MIKIGRLKLQNFKSFDDSYNFDFTDKNLVVFDGPNGYGKTTIFDALELSLVKKISRYIDVDSKVKNSGLINSCDNKTNIFLELLDSNLTSIVVVIDFDGGRYNKINDVYSKISYSYFCNWEEALSGKNKINNVPDFILDDKVKNLFNIFNYIQQEETVTFLKYDEKTRHSKISSLFGISENVKILEKIDSYLNLLYEKRTEISEGIVEKEKDRDALFKDSDFVFDGEYVEINKEEFNKDDILDKIKSYEILKNIIGNEIKYKNSLHYYSISSLFTDDLTLDDFFTYHKYSLENFEKGQKRYKSLLKKTSWLKELNNLKNTPVDLSVFLKNIEKSNIIFIRNIYESNTILIDDFFKQKDGLNGFSGELEEFKNDRELFLKSYVHNGKEFLDICSCPICGENYKTLEKFNARLATFEDYLTSISSDKNLFFDRISDEIKHKVVKPIFDRVDYFLNRYNFLNNILSNYEIYDYDLDKVKAIHGIVSDVENLNFDFRDSNSSLFLGFLNSLDVYDKEVFLSCEKALTSTDVEFFHDKFIDGGYFLVDEDYLIKRIYKCESILNSINFSLCADLNKFINLKNDLITKIDDKIISVKNLRTNYNKSIKEYETNLVSNIQIPFYIYSSKILQTRKNGSGLFIKLSENQNRNNFIKFCASKDDDSDAWNRLSSGQLSGLVIALTLSMNKAFPNKLKFLLIDDPVHYMDDINMASLIQLLMYEFNDYQFIFSTHDHKVSSYFKRKYLDYGLEASTFNLKEMKLKNIS